MEVRADKFLSGHYAYFVELPERKPRKSLEKEVLLANVRIPLADESGAYYKRVKPKTESKYMN